MLYRLQNENDKINGLEPLDYFDLSELSKIEKDLENLIAENLLDKLFEDNALMPIHQERNYQSEADIYALNENGDLVMFELKRGVVGDDAMIQILRYSQRAGQWGYDKLNRLFQKNNPGDDLIEAHREAFELERGLTPGEFNRNQHLYVVGSAANNDLAKSLNYWKSKGLYVEFIPYRLYRIGKEIFFEFFAKPNDIHSNPGDVKGVILDTNRTYNENSVWEMLNKQRASAYGEQKRFANYLKKKDYVFLSHKHYGIIAGGTVSSSSTKDDGKEERYVTVNWLTKVPKKQDGIKKYMKFSEVTELLGHGFYWARTLKTPYLSKDESLKLLEALIKKIGK